MTIDEAIKHCKEVAEANDQGLYDAIALGGQNPTQEEIVACEQCAADHRQLAEWLKELVSLKERRGRWEYYKNIGIMNIYICTNCNNKVEMAIDVEPSSFCYCPKCRADMREHEAIKGRQLGSIEEPEQGD